MFTTVSDAPWKGELQKRRKKAGGGEEGEKEEDGREIEEEKGGKMGETEEIGGGEWVRQGPQLPARSAKAQEQSPCKWALSPSDPEPGSEGQTLLFFAWVPGLLAPPFHSITSPHLSSPLHPAPLMVTNRPDPRTTTCVSFLHEELRFSLRMSSS